MAETWVVAVFSSMSAEALAKLHADIGIDGFRFKKQPEKQLASYEIIYFDI